MNEKTIPPIEEDEGLEINIKVNDLMEQGPIIFWYNYKDQCSYTTPIKGLPRTDHDEVMRILWDVIERINE